MTFTIMSISIINMSAFDFDSMFDDIMPNRWGRE